MKQCPQCGSTNVTVQTRLEDIPYGEPPLTIPATFPVDVCGDCEGEFIVHEGMLARDRAVQDFLMPHPRVTFMQLLSELYPETVVFRTMSGKVRAVAMIKMLDEGDPIALAWATDVMRDARDIIARQALWGG